MDLLKTWVGCLVRVFGVGNDFWSVWASLVLAADSLLDLWGYLRGELKVVWVCSLWEAGFILEELWFNYFSSSWNLEGNWCNFQCMSSSNQSAIFWDIVLSSSSSNCFFFCF